jgi:hypothetical protein
MAAEGDYWPLPWYLRGFQQVGWWNHPPADPSAPVMILSPQFEAALSNSPACTLAGNFELRPQVLLQLYVQQELWTNWVARARRER